ncbi:MAG: hypothetical protein ACK5VI_05215 [Opitutia bacterium]
MAGKPNTNFQAAIGALVVVFGLGSWFAYSAWQGHGKALADLRRADVTVGGLLRGAPVEGAADPVALTEANVTAAKNDLAALQARQVALRNAIAGEADNQIVSKFGGIANELGTQIQESVSRWRRDAAAKDVKLPKDEICFGFRRYVRNVGTQPQRLYTEVDRQRLIIGWLFNTLLESRASGSPLFLQSIDREPIETFPQVSGPAGDSQVFTLDTPSAEVLSVKPQSDEFILSGHTYRRPGLVGSLAFQVRFVGRTDTLRAFVNLIQNSGRPVVISSIQVASPSAEALRELFAAPASLTPAGAVPGAIPALAFGGIADAPVAPGTPADKPKAERLPVVRDGAAEFIVRIEYLFPVAEAPAPADANNATAPAK